MDQSPYGNHLGQRHKLVNASRHIVTVGSADTPVYGMWFDPGFGMHVDKTRGVPTGNDPESMYAVMSGKHYNDKCCFDYGNSETDDRDDGAGAMEAIYFGNAHWHGNSGGGPTGPWAGADLEAGMYVACIYPVHDRSSPPYPNIVCMCIYIYTPEYYTPEYIYIMGFYAYNELTKKKCY